MPSSVFSMSFPRFFGANIPWRRLSSAFSLASERFFFSSLSRNPRCSAAAYPAILPSIMAELASSIPDTSPATKIPGMDVSPYSSHFGTTPPFFGSSIISQPALLRSWDIGDRPTARHTISTSKCFSVPGFTFQSGPTSPIVTPVTSFSPSASTMVWDR